MDYMEELDCKSAKERFIGNEKLYKKFLYSFPNENLMEPLEKYINEQNLEEAFKAAHTMKGVAANLSLYKLMNVCSGVTETLRAKQMPEDADVANLKTAYQTALDAIGKIKENDAKLFT